MQLAGISFPAFSRRRGKEYFGVGVVFSPFRRPLNNPRGGSVECHSEPFGYAQDKLREESKGFIEDIAALRAEALDSSLRSVQNDNWRAASGFLNVDGDDPRRGGSRTAIPIPASARMTMQVTRHPNRHSRLRSGIQAGSLLIPLYAAFSLTLRRAIIGST